MKFWLTGLNHKTAPVEVRERLAFDQNALPEALEQLKIHPDFAECLILSTCNRVEVAVTADDNADAQAALEDFLSRQKRLDLQKLRPHLYSFGGTEAIRHLFRVAASLDSMVIGEPQILGQLKNAYSVAKERGAVNGILDSIVTRAFSVAKRVRTETEIGASAVSISYSAVELAREIFGTLRGKKVMLIGAGKMSELAARHLARSGSTILVTNRTASRAEELADLVGGTIVPYAEMYDRLPDADIVITSSGAPDYILTRDRMRRIIDIRRNKPMFLIDIAVPRNIEPAVNKVDNVFLYDIDDLQKVVDSNQKTRLHEAEEADKIVAEEVVRLEQWLRQRQATPVIVELQDSLERIRAGELERIRGRLGKLTPQQEEAIEAMTRSLMNKIAHAPISELRSAAGAAEGATIVDVIRRVFRLDRA